MQIQTSKGIDLYNFPNNIAHQLYWMEDNYINCIINTLEQGFTKQDPSTQLIAIKCEKEPELETLISQSTNKISSMKVLFSLQILLMDGSGTHWRLYGINQYLGSDLETNEPKLTSDFELERAVEVEG
jgi:hypothetical protein